MKDRATGGFHRLRDLGLQFFANRSIKKQNTKQLKKSIAHWTDRAEEHRQKIKHPEQYDREWNNKTAVQRNGLLRYWEKEVRNFETNIRDAHDELERRGDDE